MMQALIISGLAANKLSGLSCCLEAADETDGMTTGEPEEEMR